jgi:hypothetical protein
MPIKTPGQYLDKHRKESDMEGQCENCDDWKAYNYSYGGHCIGRCVLLGDGLSAMPTRDNMSCPRWKERETIPNRILDWKPKWFLASDHPIDARTVVMVVKEKNHPNLYTISAFWSSPGNMWKHGAGSGTAITTPVEPEYVPLYWSEKL